LVAGASAFVAAGAGGGLWLSSVASGSQAAALTLSGADPFTHVSGMAALTATSWGTRIQLRVSGIPEYLQCHLVVRSRSGSAEVSGIWAAWEKDSVSVPASSSLRPSDIASIQVTTPTGNLLTMSAVDQGAGAGR
jgi:hypothetical protein